MFLTRKYPLPQSENWLRDTLFQGVIVFLLLYILQPFGINQYPGNKLLFTLGYGVITSIFNIPIMFILFHWLPKKIDQWKIWHHALSTILMVLYIGIVNFAYSVIIHSCEATFFSMSLYIYWTLVIGIILTSLNITIKYNQHLKNRLESLLVNTKEENKDIIITINDASVRGDNLELPLNSLLYIEASKNDVIVYYQSEGSVKKAELHNTLSAVLTDLQCYTNICQCHRSFIINVDNITSAKGNSNGYQLLLGECTNIIPVSRTFVSKLKSYIA